MSSKTETKAATTTTASSSSSSAAAVADKHGTPSGDCAICCLELDTTNYVEYTPRPLSSSATTPNSWYPSPFCEACLAPATIDTQWQKYLDNIAKADCAAALKRVITAPPPLNVRDIAAFKECKGNGYDDEVQAFWYSSSNTVGSAKLKGSLEGTARQAFWEEKKVFQALAEKHEAEEKAAKEKQEAAATAKK